MMLLRHTIIALTPTYQKLQFVIPTASDGAISGLCYLQSVVVVVVVAESEGDEGDKRRQSPPNEGVHGSLLEPETTTVTYL